MRASTANAEGVATAADTTDATRQWLTARRHAGLELPRDMFSAPANTAASANGAAPRVVIVGRALHGTNEIARFEQSVWMAASAIEGFDILAVDVGLAEGHAVDAWIQTGQGDLDAIVDSLAPWGWSHAEARSLIEALRRKNSEKTSRTVTFIGIGVGSTYPMCQPLLAYLRKVYPDGAPRVELVIQALCSPSAEGRPRYARLDDNDRAILQYGLDETISMTRERAEEYVAKSNAVEYAQALARLTALVQYEQTVRFELTGGDRDPRGQILAENVIAELARADAADAVSPSTTPSSAQSPSGSAPKTPKRMLVLAHVRDLARTSDADSFAAQLETLAQIHPLCIATAAGSAKFRALDPNDHAKGPSAPRDLVIDTKSATEFENVLAQCGAGDALFDLRASSTPAPPWFDKLRALRSARALCGGPLETAWDFAVARDFDALVWFGEVHESKVAAPK